MSQRKRLAAQMILATGTIALCFSFGVIALPTTIVACTLTFIVGLMEYTDINGREWVQEQNAMATASMRLRQERAAAEQAAAEEAARERVVAEQQAAVHEAYKAALEERRKVELKLEQSQPHQALLNYIEGNDVASVQRVLNTYELEVVQGRYFNKRDLPLLILALQKNNEAIIGMLVQKIKPAEIANMLRDIQNNEQFKKLVASLLQANKITSAQAFFYFIQIGDIQSVTQLLDTHKFDLNQIISSDEIIGYTGHEGSTPLTLASRKGHFGLVTFLLENGAEPNKRGGENGDGSMALAEAACKSTPNHVKIVKLLIKKGAEVDATVSTNPSYARQTALTLALSVPGFSFNNLPCNDEIIEVLLNNGAEVNNLEGEPSENHLFLAMYGRRDTALCHLLQHKDLLINAKFTAKNNHSYTALEFAIVLLYGKKNPGDHDDLDSFEDSDKRRVVDLLEAGAKLESEDNKEICHALLKEAAHKYSEKSQTEPDISMRRYYLNKALKLALRVHPDPLFDREKQYLIYSYLTGITVYDLSHDIEIGHQKVEEISETAHENPEAAYQSIKESSDEILGDLVVIDFGKGNIEQALKLALRVSPNSGFDTFKRRIIFAYLTDGKDEQGMEITLAPELEEVLQTAHLSPEQTYSDISSLKQGIPLPTASASTISTTNTTTNTGSLDEDESESAIETKSSTSRRKYS